MAVRASPGQLDEISQAIGRVDAYVHEYRHGINNIAQQISAMELASEKRHTTLKLELKAELRESNEAIRTDLATIASRVAKLEEARLRHEGAVGVFAWFAQHWPFATVAAGLAAFIAWATGRVHL
jgi:hypothetical protein